MSRASWHLLQEQAFLHLGYEHTTKVRDGFILSRLFWLLSWLQRLSAYKRLRSQESLRWEHEANRQCN